MMGYWPSAIGDQLSADSLQPIAAKPKTVRHDAHRAQRHRRAGDHRTQPDAPSRVERPGGDRDTHHLVDERPEEILPHRGDGAPGEMDRAPDGPEVAAENHHVARLR